MTILKHAKKCKNPTAEMQLDQYKLLYKNLEFSQT